MSQLTDADKMYVALVAMYNAENSPAGQSARTRCDQVYSDLGVQNANCSSGNEQYQGMFDVWKEATGGFACFAAGGTFTNNKCPSGCLGYDGKCMK